jgi:hypothetical protein
MVRALRAPHAANSDYFGMLTCSPASAVIMPVIMPVVVVVPMVVRVRMIIRGGSALTGRIGRHSTAGLAVVAAA